MENYQSQFLYSENQHPKICNRNSSCKQNNKKIVLLVVVLILFSIINHTLFNYLFTLLLLFILIRVAVCDKKQILQDTDRFLRFLKK